MPNDPFYTSPAWRACRRQFLAAHPSCSVAGCTRASTNADHRVTRRAGGAPFAWSNLAALCASHHSEKTARADGGFGRPTRSGVRLIARGCTADGTPISPDHHWSRK